MKIVEEWLDYAALQRIDKKALHALCWSSARPLQQRIDEEGCGAVMVAAKYLEN